MNLKKIATLALSPPKVLTYGFALIILTGALLLTLPLSSAYGNRLAFLDAFFMATSATCVTGLAVVDVGVQFSHFGQVVILVLTQIGGLGFMTMGTLIALAFNRRISLRERLILQEAMNYNSMEGLLSLIRRVIIYSLFIELTGALLLTIRWMEDMPFLKALYFGIYHSVTMFNNAGFDLFGTMTGPFSGFNGYVNDVYINIVVMILIFFGGIGFVVMSDLLDFRNTRKLSLHSKVVLTYSSILVIVGALLFYILERANPLTLGPLHEGSRIMSSFFHSISSRSGGVSTINLPDLDHSTQFMLLLLMFIGAAPGSTGGGIKVTVFAVLIGAMIAMIRGKEDIVMFKKRLAKDVIIKAVTQTWLALFLVSFVAMVLSVIEDRSFLALLFETTSAFGTTGMSLGLTPTLSPFSKIIICIVMFLGRVGPLTLAYALAPKPKKELYRYPEGKITIG
ncbi:trk system potassium uptake protein TrkH [Paenibacillus shirakamiensis]|uniref:Trk system potassium uptake protein TrkH n=1 Tax=Paenibacillus shirakamiensis TaxID=1265935 RepID=A0ABS4JDW5_9BACL|nr:TrkH family potassium uptake protein [Paenibacillus shirakamiensis]MBP1999875.1 trk system potassium uptake protein TrkH [Paenibacillus shirakamiensis]